MYLTYETRQYAVKGLQRSNMLSKLHTHPPQRFGPTSEPAYKPSKLVRVSDMQVVKGSDIKEGYFALSYSHNWSGETIPQEDGKDSIRDDNGLHKLVVYEEKVDTRRLARGRKKPRQLSRTVKHVKFETIIQQICKDFNINYIWYDKMCIDQSDHDEKMRELKQMYLVYGHAHCTIALIPELKVYSPRSKTGDKWMSVYDIAGSEWGKRAWTLEEALMSRNLLFVGRNVHLWSHTVTTHTLLSTTHTSDAEYLRGICQKPLRWSTSTVLRQFNRQTSTRPHDKIFALANVFPELMDKIEFSYRQDLHELTTQFFSLLAKKDLSILCFGFNQFFHRYFGVTKLQDYNGSSPSWTGSFGAYISPIDEEPIYTSFSDFTFTKGILHTTCDCVYVTMEKASLSSERVSYCHFDENLSLEGQHSPIQVRLPDKNRLTVVPARNYQLASLLSTSLDDYQLTVTHVLLLNQENDAWINTTKSSVSTVGAYLSLTVPDCKECLILSGIPFNTPDTNWKLYPVVTKFAGYYRSIGLCHMYDSFEFPSSALETKEINIK